MREGKGWSALYSFLTYHKCSYQYNISIGYDERNKLLDGLRKDMQKEIELAQITEENFNVES